MWSGDLIAGNLFNSLTGDVFRLFVCLLACCCRVNLRVRMNIGGPRVSVCAGRSRYEDTTRTRKWPTYVGR